MSNGRKGRRELTRDMTTEGVVERCSQERERCWRRSKEGLNGLFERQGDRVCRSCEVETVRVSTAALYGFVVVCSPRFPL